MVPDGSGRFRTLLPPLVEAGRQAGRRGNRAGRDRLIDLGRQMEQRLVGRVGWAGGLGGWGVGERVVGDGECRGLVGGVRPRCPDSQWLDAPARPAFISPHACSSSLM